MKPMTSPNAATTAGCALPARRKQNDRRNAADQTGDLLDWELPLTSRGGSPLGVWALESAHGLLAAGGDFTGPRARLAVVSA
jgi:hypothetical protein